jgi:DNA (cytosine-5)-methyltransferase 1
MTFGSLFAGIGGLDLGLERAGMECKWQVEIDDYCRKVLTKHWPNVPKYGDIRHIDGTGLQPVDLICAGYPCQPFSQAGQRKGEEDERHLFPEVVRIAGILRPRYLLLENVPGHLSLGFGSVLADLAGFGYDCEWLCLRASDFGAAHLQEAGLHRGNDMASAHRRKAPWIGGCDRGQRSTKGSNLKRSKRRVGRRRGHSFRSRGGDRKDEPGLDQQARFFPTPAARDYRTPNKRTYQERSETKKGEQLQNFVEHRFLSSLPVPAIQDGPPFSESVPISRRRLNPRFVEWLMGFPIGWTEL